MRAPEARCRACKGVVRRLAAVSVIEQNGTRQETTAMTVLAAEREGQGTEMSGCGAQEHRAATQTVEYADEMLGRDLANRGDLMRAQDGHLMRQ